MSRSPWHLRDGRARPTRRAFLASAGAGLGLAAGGGLLAAAPRRARAASRPKRRPIMLIRYDVEKPNPTTMKGFFDALVPVHRKHRIPVTFFCTGKAIEARAAEFRALWAEIKGDPLFDIQSHSYSEAGLGMAHGRSVEALEQDYLRAGDVHARFFGQLPVGVAIPFTGRDGKMLSGFDATEKAKRELEMMANLGLLMIDAHLSWVVRERDFTNFDALGHPQVMGFPSGNSDTSWMWQRKYGDPMTYIKSVISAEYAAGHDLPIMLHDWVAYLHAPDKKFTHVAEIAAHARKVGYEIRLHVDCWMDYPLWVAPKYLPYLSGI